MKKFFLFAAVAGMLASCSSESLTGSDPNIEPTQEERVPIEINVANSVSRGATRGATRGVGTVGDIVGGTNHWQGEKVNVFMFNKGTLTPAEDGEGNDIYKNTALTTPTGSESAIAYEYYDSNTDDTDDRVRYKYYPVTGNFDFWGYFIDDASNGAISYDEKEVVVPFKIDGTQDLMVAKAEPTTAQQDIIDDDAFGTDKTRFYSAYAARRGVQPDMTFKHLLTRLTFSILGGDDKACGFVSPGHLPDDNKPYEGVFVKSIKVKSKITGNIIAAYTASSTVVTNGTPAELISFDNTGGPANDGYDMLTLMGDRVGNQVAPLYDPAIFEVAGDPAPWSTEYMANHKLLLVNGANAHWGEIVRPTSTTDPKTVGSALLVSSEDKYDIEIVLGQYLLDSEDMPAGSGDNPEYKVVYATIEREITPTLPATTFEQGTSYNVQITLYGFEKIKITTTLQAWNNGGKIPVEAE